MVTQFSLFLHRQINWVRAERAMRIEDEVNAMPTTKSAHSPRDPDAKSASNLYCQRDIDCLSLE